MAYDPKKLIEDYFDRQPTQAPIKSLFEYFSDKRQPHFSEDEIKEAVRLLVAGKVIEEIQTKKDGVHYRKIPPAGEIPNPAKSKSTPPPAGER